jgi:hypothetical protein
MCTSTSAPSRAGKWASRIRWMCTESNSALFIPAYSSCSHSLKALFVHNSPDTEARANARSKGTNTPWYPLPTLCAYIKHSAHTPSRDVTVVAGALVIPHTLTCLNPAQFCSLKTRTAGRIPNGTYKVLLQILPTHVRPSGSE